MQLKHGTYSFAANSVRLSARVETLFNAAKIPYAQRRTLGVSGALLGTSQADLTTQSAALAAALALPFKDLIFYQDDGSESATYLKNAGSLGGVVITRGPDFGGEKGWEYASGREFSFEAMAEYPLTGTEAILLDWTETVSFGGGLPLYAMKRAINGPPQRQMIYAQTEYAATQSGSATGYRLYPKAPSAIWPNALKEAPVITYTAPDLHGLAGYEKWKTAWEYRYESATPLVGAPTLWTR